MNQVQCASKSLRIGTALVLAVFTVAVAGTAIPAQAQISTSPDDKSPLTIIHNTWSSGAPMPTAVMNDQAVGVLKGEMYVVGGYNGTEVIADTQIYNPTTNTWSAGTSLPTPVSAASAAVVNSVLYVFGGWASWLGSIINNVQIYQP